MEYCGRIYPFRNLVPEKRAVLKMTRLRGENVFLGWVDDEKPCGRNVMKYTSMCSYYTELLNHTCTIRRHFLSLFNVSVG